MVVKGRGKYGGEVGSEDNEEGMLQSGGVLPFKGLKANFGFFFTLKLFSFPPPRPLRCYGVQRLLLASPP